MNVLLFLFGIPALLSGNIALGLALWFFAWMFSGERTRHTDSEGRTY